jgi:hypothetical protein
MIMQKMRCAGHAPPKSKAGFYPVPNRPAAGLKTGRRLSTASSRYDGFPSSRSAIRATPAEREFSIHCFIWCFLFHVAIHRGGTGVASIQATPLTKENIMKLQLGQNQLVFELSKSPFAWFHGQTERMSLTSLSLLFVQFSLFARQPAV